MGDRGMKKKRREEYRQNDCRQNDGRREDRIWVETQKLRSLGFKPRAHLLLSFCRHHFASPLRSFPVWFLFPCPPFPCPSLLSPLRGFLWVAPTGCNRSSRAVCPPPSRHGELGGFAPKPPGFFALRARAARATIALPLRRIGLRWEPTRGPSGGRAAGDDSPKAVVPAVF